MCVGVRGCVGVRVGESRGRLGSTGKLPKFSNFHPEIAPNSAPKAPLASIPQRKPELCAAPEPERPDAVRVISKVRGSPAGESAGAGKKVLRSSVEKRALARLAGRRERWQAKRFAGGQAGGGPSAPSGAAFEQKNKFPQTPRPARPPPAPRACSAGVLRPRRPAQRPAGRPGLPQRSRLPWRWKRGARRAECEAAEPPAPGTHAATASRSRSVPPDPGAPGKSPHRRAAAAPHRARPPAASAPDSGAVAVAATALRSWRRGPALKPPLPPREP